MERLEGWWSISNGINISSNLTILDIKIKKGKSSSTYVATIGCISDENRDPSIIFR